MRKKKRKRKKKILIVQVCSHYDSLLTVMERASMK
jgi:hypothetical protein